MGTNIGEELMGRMADLDAELHELPDEAKDFMQGFYRGRDEGLAIGQEEGKVMERERIISLIENTWTEYPDVDALTALIAGGPN
jgi:hypothetical protein